MDSQTENINGDKVDTPKQIRKAGGSSDEKAPDSSDNGGTIAKPPKKGSKAKKRKKPKDATAPRHPLTGYVRYLNDRREEVRSSNPNLPFAEITKLLASEWSNLPTDKKQQYLDAAEQDRVRYTREFNAYKQTEAYKIFTQAQSDKKLKESKEESQKANPPPQPPVLVKEPPQNNNESDFSNFDVPIFTEEFLDHNKTREAELRQLRKSNTDYEQQNAILQKHIENMKTAIEKLENETIQQRNNNVALQQHLDHLRLTLANGFASVKLPGTNEVATLQSIDNYMTHLHSLLLENSNHSLMQTVRDIVGRLEFNG